MKITIYNKLRKFDRYLFTSYYSDYVRGLTSREVQELSEIGNEVGIPYKHNGCPKCLLNFIKKLAKPYFEQQKKLEEKKKQKQEEKENENK